MAVLTTVLLVCISGAFAQQKDTIAIIDAGSSGSRLFVYEVAGQTIRCIFPIGKKQENDSKGEALSKIQPQNAQETDSFLANMTKNYQTSGKKKDLYVLATAGMRLVKESRADSIYSQMRNKTVNNYTVKEAMTISGRYEAFYAWIATNYRNKLLGFSISTPLKPLTYTGTPVGIVEIGGASMQIAFATSATNNSNSSDFISREGFSNIYCKSYLGGGADQIYETYKDSPFYKKYMETKDSTLLDYSWKVPNLPHIPSDISFYGLGKPIEVVIDSKKQSLKDYIEAIKQEDSVSNYHPKSNAMYINWLFSQLKINGKVKAAKKQSSWTEGAVIDIIVNKETPEKFNYQNPN